MIKQIVMCLLPIMSSQFVLDCLAAWSMCGWFCICLTVVKSVLEKMRIARHPFSELLQNATKVIVSIWRNTRAWNSINEIILNIGLVTLHIFWLVKTKITEKWISCNWGPVSVKVPVIVWLVCLSTSRSPTQFPRTVGYMFCIAHLIWSKVCVYEQQWNCVTWPASRLTTH